MNFFLNGQEQPVVIDDRLPVTKEQKPINARPSHGGKGWWLPLLEKAYAKVSVNYENLNGGDGVDQLAALRTLTGAPVDRISMKDPSFRQRLHDHYLNDHVLSFYVSDKAKETFGLKPNASYNIVDIEVEEGNGSAKSMKAIKVRDPWLEGPYSGPLAASYDKAEKTVMIPIEKFVEAFDAVNVAMLDDDWKVVRHAEAKSTAAAYEMAFTNSDGTQDVWLTLDYPTRWMRAPGCPEGGVSFEISVKDQHGATIENADTVDQISYGMIAFTNLSSGTYYVHVTMKGDVNKAAGFTVSLYSKHAALKFEDQTFALSGSLREAARRKDKELFEKSYLNGSIAVRAYLQRADNALTVEVGKKEKEDATVTIKV